MYWKQTEHVDNGRYLAVAIKIMDGVYQEFAGCGRTVAEAKTNATLTMWRASRRCKNLPDDHVGDAINARRSRIQPQ